jgi:glycosyltransferase involved in cell wall biosynthesis
VPTSDHEGFGVPVVEAMAMGLPVVANAAGALPEVLGPGGVLVDTTDPWALAEATAAVLADPARRDALVAGAQAQLRTLDLATAGDRAIDLVSQVC